MARDAEQDSGPDVQGFSCPVPLQNYDRILLGHGSGGKLMQDLLDELVLPRFSNKYTRNRHDCAVIPCGDRKIAFTTDSYVVNPLFFAGGDIGSLAVNGTVNDLAMGGARPLYLSAGLIIEEGLATKTLDRILASMKLAADHAGVLLVTGDTKVVDHGKGDGIFINTAGIGMVEHDLELAAANVREGDVILLNGDVGRHGVAVMSGREGLEFEAPVESDCCALADIVLKLVDEGIPLHCLRDCTRGGVATTLVEISKAAGTDLEIDEGAVPVIEGVRGACELLGLDPLYVANEGRFIAVVPEEASALALETMRAHADGRDAAIVGRVGSAGPGNVSCRTVIGVRRRLEMLSGEQLPRIC